MPSEDTLVFHTRPGCLSGRRQQEFLRGMGFSLEVRDMITRQWEAAELDAFFGQRPISDCFNPSAPAIKSGAIDPGSIDRGQALAAMVAEPLLIRRPLMEFRGVRFTGFDLDGLLAVINGTCQMPENTVASSKPHPLEQCSVTPGAEGKAWQATEKEGVEREEVAS